MQIDFHHATTYVIGRAAGLSHEEAEMVAYSAQYVDDATEAGLLHFYTSGIDRPPEPGPTYSRISSAHKTIDYRNASELANRRVWIPFHFLPGNDGRDQNHKWNPEQPFFPRLVCRPNSPVARAMVQSCIHDKVSDCDANYTLQNPAYKRALCRLGITMHVYADTWAHQDFVGIAHEFNRLEHIASDDPERDSYEMGRLEYRAARGFIDNIASRVSGGALPLGHGAALSYPDLPYLTWRYRKRAQWHAGEWVESVNSPIGQDADGLFVRNNTELFLAAADHMYAAMSAFRNDQAEVDLGADQALPAEYRERIQELFTTLIEPRPDKRHAHWLEVINRGGFFPFDLAQGQKLHYAPDEKAWKYAILDMATRKLYRSGIPHRTALNFLKFFYVTLLKKLGLPGSLLVRYDATFQYPADNAFLSSNWKMFHDALMTHRQAVLQDVLTRFNICVS